MVCCNPSCRFLEAARNQRAISSARRNRSNTSFESNRPRDVKQTKSSRCSISPPSTSSAIAARASSIASSPNFAASSRKLTPRVSRSPRKKLSSKAAWGETAVRSKPAAHVLFQGIRGRKSHRLDVRRSRSQHRMRVHAKAEVGEPRPILQVVPRLETLAREVGNLILRNPRRCSRSQAAR